MRDRVSGKFRDFWLFDVYQDRDGAIWFASRTGELIRYNGSSAAPRYVRFGETDGIDIGGRRPGTKMAETADGHLWTVTALDVGGLNRFDEKSWTTSRLTDIGGSDENQSLSVSADGTLWVGGSGTLHAYQDGLWKVYRAPEAPIQGGRIIVHADQRGGLWLGGVGRGISRLDLSNSRHLIHPSLSVQFESANHIQWYLTESGRVVTHRDGRWGDTRRSSTETRCASSGARQLRVGDSLR